MNILFIGPYRQNDGWGKAAQDYVRSINTTEHNLSIKPIYMSNHISFDIDNDLLELENTHYNNYDCVIQQVLPSLFSHNCNTKLNILLCVFETYSMYIHPWSNYLMNIDHILVPSIEEKLTLNEILPNTKVVNISCPINTQPLENFEKKHQSLSIGSLRGDFLFYFIGEHIERKNLLTFIEAFYNEFDLTEPVNMLIKTNKTGFQYQELNTKLIDEINIIQKRSRKYHTYKMPVIITEHITDEEMLKLHTTGDCFVMPSRGEAFCRPAIEAMCIGKTPIVTSNTGMQSFVSSDNGYLVKSNKTNISTIEPPIPNIYTAHEKWFEIDISHFQQTMRHVYEHHNCKEHLAKQQHGKSTLNKFSYKQIGKNISEALDEFNN